MSGWFGWAASAIKPAVEIAENDAALVVGSLEPLLPGNEECEGVVVGDIKDLTQHIIHDVETYGNNHLPTPPFTANQEQGLNALPTTNRTSSGGELLPVDSDELKQILRSMSKRHDAAAGCNETLSSSSSSIASNSSTTSNGWQFHHIGHVNEKDAKRITITSTQLNELSKQYEQATGRKSEFYEKLKQQFDAPNNSATTSSSSATDSEARADVKNNVVIRTDQESGDQVAVVDLSQLEWWTFINDKETDTNSASSAAGSEGEKSSRSSPVPAETEDGWQLIDNDDFVRALSDFIAETMKNNPDIAGKLPPEELKKMLTDVFIQVKQPGTASRLWQWGTFAYHAYSWGTTIMQLYNNKLVIQGLYAAASWVLVLLF